MNKKIIQKVVVGGIVINSNREVLLLQRHAHEDIYPNMWELPSGKKEPLEKTEEALRREMREETGLSVDEFIPVSIFDYQIEKPDEIRDSTQINFLIKTSEPKVTLSAEHQNFAWVKETDIHQYSVSEATKKVIMSAFNH